MTTACPALPDERRLRAEISRTYERVANAPEGRFHFHRGAAYAVERLGYDAGELASLPEEATAAFAGVGNPHRAGPLRAGETVLDLGCGAGTDLLLAARRVGPSGRVIGVEMTTAMRLRALRAAYAAGLADRVEVREGLVESIPLEDASVDVVQSNGVLNLVVDKERAFAEVARVLRPGGRFHLADVVIRGTFSEATTRQVDLWAA